MTRTHVSQSQSRNTEDQNPILTAVPQARDFAKEDPISYEAFVELANTRIDNIEALVESNPGMSRKEAAELLSSLFLRMYPNLSPDVADDLAHNRAGHTYGSTGTWNMRRCKEYFDPSWSLRHQYDYLVEHGGLGRHIITCGLNWAGKPDTAPASDELRALEDWQLPIITDNLWTNFNGLEPKPTAHLDVEVRYGAAYRFCEPVHDPSIHNLFLESAFTYERRLYAYVATGEDELQPRSPLGSWGTFLTDFYLLINQPDSSALGKAIKDSMAPKALDRAMLWHLMRQMDIMGLDHPIFVAYGGKVEKAMNGLMSDQDALDAICGGSDPFYARVQLNHPAGSAKSGYMVEPGTDRLILSNGAGDKDTTGESRRCNLDRLNRIQELCVERANRFVEQPAKTAA